jgi:DNA-binding NarL/FixJ family response regulator
MRVVIAEDSAVLRAGLIEVLTDGGHAVAAAVGTADALLAAVAEHRPDAAVVDVRMPPSHTDEGLRAAVRIRRDYPGTGILVFSQYIQTGHADELLTEPSGVGYLLKERVADVGEFLDALERIGAGGTALDPEVVARILRVSRRGTVLATLTPRERDVLELMAEGRSNSAVAARLAVSEASVEKHVSSIFAKLGLERSGSDNRRVLAVLHYLESRDT